MKKRRVLDISFVTLLVSIVTLVIVYAWYINATMHKTPIIQSEEYDGLNLTLYRGYDYDFNGVLDSREEIYETLDSTGLNAVKNDLNERYINIQYADAFDKITGVIDNNVITYRLLIRNESDKEFKLNPYFIFTDDSEHHKQNSIIFTLSGLNQFNHTFRNKDGDLIDTLGGANHFNTSNLKFFTYDISQGLYDTYMNPIEAITDGVNVYTLEYGDNSITVKKDGTVITGDKTKVNLTLMYYYNAYNGDDKITNYTKDTLAYDTKSTLNSDPVPYKMEYNAYNSRTRNHSLFANIEDDTEVELGKNYPSKYYAVNKNLSNFMYREKLTTMDTIIVDSYSEYYLDYYIVVNSQLTSLNRGMSDFATLHNIDTDAALATTNKSGYDYDYKVMNNKLKEMQQQAEINKPNFKIESFCFDVKTYNNYSSYLKNVTDEEGD